MKMLTLYLTMLILMLLLMLLILKMLLKTYKLSSLGGLIDNLYAIVTLHLVMLTPGLIFSMWHLTLGPMQLSHCGLGNVSSLILFFVPIKDFKAVIPFSNYVLCLLIANYALQPNHVFILCFKREGWVQGGINSISCASYGGLY